MSHVVMQAAEFPNIEAAGAAMARLEAFYSKYVEFEATDPNPWSWDAVPDVLTRFGNEFGVDWPHTKTARFMLKGAFRDTAELLCVGRLVFFWGGGFEMGGDTFRAVLAKMGATKTAEFCELVIHNDDPDGLIEAWVESLEADDFEDQFTLDPEEDGDWLHTITVKGPTGERLVAFDDSGVSDWAFTSLLPQLVDLDPRFV